MQGKEQRGNQETSVYLESIFGRGCGEGKFQGKEQMWSRHTVTSSHCTICFSFLVFTQFMSTSLFVWLVNMSPTPPKAPWGCLWLLCSLAASQTHSRHSVKVLEWTKDWMLSHFAHYYSWLWSKESVESTPVATVTSEMVKWGLLFRVAALIDLHKSVIK